jgi:hypothetical protein
MVPPSYPEQTDLLPLKILCEKIPNIFWEEARAFLLYLKLRSPKIFDLYTASRAQP